MKEHILEICVDSVESALAAERGGADRLELCQNLVIGGTTPGPKLLEAVKGQIHIPIHVLIRPRFGDFCYTEYEMEQMKEEVQMFHELGADGIVIGILSPNGSLNCSGMEKLIGEKGDMSVTLHRAFDVCKDPIQTLREAEKLGVRTILTSGQQDTCQKGVELLKRLQREGGDKICIMAGGGVTPENIEELYCKTKIKVYHMSAKIEMESTMTYRNPDVHMGMADVNEYSIFRTSQEKVRQAAEVLRHL